MAKSKKQNEISYFFMSVVNGDIEVNCTGDDNEIAAAFAALIVDKTKENKSMQAIFATAIAVAAHTLESKKEKYTSKKSNKVPKTPTKAPKKK
jgi:hypothetical protein